MNEFRSFCEWNTERKENECWKAPKWHIAPRHLMYASVLFWRQSIWITYSHAHMCALYPQQRDTSRVSHKRTSWNNKTSCRMCAFVCRRRAIFTTETETTNKLCMSFCRSGTEGSPTGKKNERKGVRRKSITKEKSERTDGGGKKSDGGHKRRPIKWKFI